MSVRKGDSGVRLPKGKEHRGPWGKSLELCWVLGQGFEIATLLRSYLQGLFLSSIARPSIIPRGIGHGQHLPCPRFLHFPENSARRCLCDSFSWSSSALRKLVFLRQKFPFLQNERTNGRGRDRKKGWEKTSGGGGGEGRP